MHLYVDNNISHLKPLLSQKYRGSQALETPVITGDRERIRTSDLPLRRRSLYPAELRNHLNLTHYITFLARHHKNFKQLCEWSIPVVNNLIFRGRCRQRDQNKIIRKDRLFGITGISSDRSSPLIGEHPKGAPRVFLLRVISRCSCRNDTQRGHPRCSFYGLFYADPLFPTYLFLQPPADCYPGSVSPPASSII